MPETVNAGVQYVRNILCAEPSPLGQTVAQLLEWWAVGIYHLGDKELRRVEWDNGRFMQIRVRRSLASYDFNDLTRLVFMAHHFCVRVEVHAIANNLLGIMFHPRVRSGAVFERHPTLREAVEKFEQLCSEADRAKEGGS